MGVPVSKRYNSNRNSESRCLDNCVRVHGKVPQIRKPARVISEFSCYAINISAEAEKQITLHSPMNTD